MFNVVDDVAYINGVSGRYNLKESSPFARYGRNAINNLQKYQKQLQIKPIEKPESIDVANCSEEEFNAYMKKMDAFTKALKNQKLLPLNYSCRYSPTLNPDKKSLIAAAYEAMGKKNAVCTDVLSEKLQTYSTRLLSNISQKEIDEYLYAIKDNKMSAECLDVNKDKKIDLGEFATAIIYADGVDETGVFSSKNVDGSFTNVGVSSALASTYESEYEISSKMYQGIYKMYGLDRAKKDYLLSQAKLS